MGPFEGGRQDACAPRVCGGVYRLTEVLRTHAAAGSMGPLKIARAPHGASYLLPRTRRQAGQLAPECAKAYLLDLFEAAFLQFVFGLRFVLFVHDAAVKQVYLPVGVPGIARIVRNHADRCALLVQLA